MALRASSVLSQSVLNRVVGSFREQPLTLTVHPFGSFIPQLAEAAGVPMGFEMAPFEPDAGPPPRIPATGKRLRDVLDAIVSADPRYEWREDAGVIVVRPVTAWTSTAGTLDIPVGPVMLEQANRDDALHVLAQIFGAVSGEPPLRDIRRFSLGVPADTPLLQFLNAVVRAHGNLCWTVNMMAPSPGGLPRYSKFSVGLSGEPLSWGFGVPLNATIHAGPYVVRRAPPDARPTLIPTLDRVVASGRPVSIGVMAIRSLDRLAKAVGVPMGLQESSRNGALARRAFREQVDLQGMVFRDALNLLKTLDPRFDWRDMNGVIVFRPVESWSDPNDPLLQPTSAITLKDVPTAIAVQHMLLVLNRDSPPPPLDDKKRVSIQLPPATVLELLNAIARAHGEFSWGWGGVQPHLRPQVPADFQHMVEFSTFNGSGGGFPVP